MIFAGKTPVFPRSMEIQSVFPDLIIATEHDAEKFQVRERAPPGARSRQLFVPAPKNLSLFLTPLSEDNPVKARTDLGECRNKH